MRFRIILIIFATLTFSTNLFSQNKKTVNVSYEKVKEEIEKLKKDSALVHASWGLSIKSVEDNNIIAEYNSKISLVPASAMKIVTTSAALSILGSNFRFETKIEFSGYIDKEGTLQGNLYLTGGGDPTIGSHRFGSETSADAFLDSIYYSLKKKNINKINGKIISDGSIFDDKLPSGWEWDDMGNYYGAGASGICMFENAYKVLLKPGVKEGDTVEIIKTIPEIDELLFINTMTTSSKGSDDDIYIYGAPFNYLRFIDGPAPLGVKSVEVKGSIPEPDIFCSKYLYDFLNKRNIPVTDGFTSIRALQWKNINDTASRKTIYKYYSPELSRILYYTNLNSVNIFAEALLKMTGAKKSGTGSTISGIKAVSSFWKNKGIDLKGCVINDGCGLSRRNEISASQFCDILIKINKDANFDVFYNSLPIAGRTGTLRNMFKNTSAENNLRAKSGTMGDIKSYAGYVNNKKGDRIAFAIIANNYCCSNAEVRKKIEKILVLLAESE